VLPSTYQPTIGSGKWSAGPTVVALKQQGWQIRAAIVILLPKTRVRLTSED
jgi:hypothetical protein